MEKTVTFIAEDKKRENKVVDDEQSPNPQPIQDSKDFPGKAPEFTPIPIEKEISQNKE